MQASNDYRTDSAYIYHYSEKLSPNYIRTALLLEGIDTDKPEADEPYRYLELGFGRGMSLLIHAAANKGQYWGVDFLPSQADRVRNIARAAGLDCTILSDPFSAVSDMADNGELPGFDAITLHGVWSWINHENRQYILNIIRKTLNPGGVVYVSYNALPGWSFFTPVREIMVKLMERYGPEQELTKSIPEILDFLIAAGETGESPFFAFNPQALAYLKSLKSESVDYIAHEFFNSSWHNFHAHEVARDLHSVGCSFAASAYVQYQTSGVTGPRTSQLLGQIINSGIRDSMRDFVLDRKFRADYFVRDLRKISGERQAEKVAGLAFKLTRPKRDVAIEINFGYENVPIDTEIFDPVLEILDRDDLSVKTVGELFPDAASPDSLEYIQECLRILIGSNTIRPAVSGFSEDVATRCKNLNRQLRQLSIDGNDDNIIFLASPAIASGVRLPQSTIRTLHEHIPPELFPYHVEF